VLFFAAGLLEEPFQTILLLQDGTVLVLSGS